MLKTFNGFVVAVEQKVAEALSVSCLAQLYSLLGFKSVRAVLPDKFVVGV